MANDNCSTAQTFCNINGQTVGDNPSIKFKFSTLTQFNSKKKAYPNWKDEVIEGLKKINNYGSAGSNIFNESAINSLDKIASKDKIYAEDFNEILNILKINDTNKQVHSKNRLLGSYFKDLETYINSYQISSDRCNTCNSGCNTTCQANAQCNDYCNSCNVTCDTNCEGGLCPSGYEGCTGCEYSHLG